MRVAASPVLLCALVYVLLLRLAVASSTQCAEIDAAHRQQLFRGDHRRFPCVSVVPRGFRPWVNHTLVAMPPSPVFVTIYSRRKAPDKLPCSSAPPSQSCTSTVLQRLGAALRVSRSLLKRTWAALLLLFAPVSLRSAPPVATSCTQIFVKCLDGRTIAIDLPSNLDDVYQPQVCAIVHERTGVPPSQQRLLYAGRQLNADRPLSQYGITQGATLHLCLRLPGGMDRKRVRNASGTEGTYVHCDCAACPPPAEQDDDDMICDRQARRHVTLNGRRAAAAAPAGGIMSDGDDSDDEPESVASTPPESEGEEDFEQVDDEYDFNTDDEDDPLDLQLDCDKAIMHETPAERQKRQEEEATEKACLQAFCWEALSTQVLSASPAVAALRSIGGLVKTHKGIHLYPLDVHIFIHYCIHHVPKLYPSCSITVSIMFHFVSILYPFCIHFNCKNITPQKNIVFMFVLH